MGKRIIPTDTKCFKYVNANSKNKTTTDCVIRALALVTDKTWEDVFTSLYEIGLKYRLAMNDKKCYERFLKENGFIKFSQPRHSNNNSKYTGYEFCNTLISNHKPIFANIGAHHVTAIINKKINDTWDCTYNCIGTYWQKG